MAADPALLTLLVGLGLREFSMAPTAMPLAKQVLRSLRAADARTRRRARAAGARRRDVEHALVESAGAAGAARTLRRQDVRRSRARSRRRSGCVRDVKRVDKPWGYELHWAKTDRYVGKLIHVNAGHALSLQYHNQKDETIFLWSGRLLFEIQEGGQLVKREMKLGESVHVTPARSIA